MHRRGETGSFGTPVRERPRSSEDHDRVEQRGSRPGPSGSAVAVRDGTGSIRGSTSASSANRYPRRVAHVSPCPSASSVASRTRRPPSNATSARDPSRSGVLIPTSRWAFVGTGASGTLPNGSESRPSRRTGRPTPFRPGARPPRRGPIRWPRASGGCVCNRITFFRGRPFD